SADGSVGLPHVRVGHRQASKSENPQSRLRLGIFFVPLQSLPMSVGRPPGMAEVPVLQERKPAIVIRSIPGPHPFGAP
uniref:hypothetical protein n=1 Tax=Pseudohongiella nitratireducens TaxID=1768907 RepID=UPI0030EC6AC2